MQCRFAWIKKSVSLMLVLLMIGDSISWAMPGLSMPNDFSNAELRRQQPDYQVNEQWAIIEKIHWSAAHAGTVFYIKDAHGMLSAQKSIAHTIQDLQVNSNVKLLLLEGGSERLNSDMLRLSEDESVNQELYTKLFNDGYLSGAEKYLLSVDQKSQMVPAGPSSTKQAKDELATGLRGAMKSPPAHTRPDETPGMQAFGIENIPLYKENLEAFKRVYQNRDESEAFIQRVERAIKEQMVHFFTPKLRKYFLAWMQYQEGRLSLALFLRKSTGLAKEYLGLDLDDARNQWDYPSLIRLRQIVDLEEKWSPEDLKHERETFLADIKTHISDELFQTIENIEDEDLPMTCPRLLYQTLC